MRAHFELALLSRILRGTIQRTRELKTANDQLRGLATALSLVGRSRALAAHAGALHDGPMQKFALAQIQIDALLHPRRVMAASAPRTEEPETPRWH